jgi:hypothetical protein
MNIRDDDQVSAVALVVDSEATAAPVIGEEGAVDTALADTDIAPADAPEAQDDSELGDGDGDGDNDDASTPE